MISNKHHFQNTQLLHRVMCKLRMVKLIARYIKDLARYSVRYGNKSLSRYPNTIQLPITFKCNFDCIMCGMCHLTHNHDMTLEELEHVLNDKLYSRVNTVGLNGGEPFIRKDVVECVELITEKLPKLQHIYIISNGFFTDLITEKLKKIHAICKARSIKVHVSFSVDGVGPMQDYMRGRANAWNNVTNTIHTIINDKDVYCDDIGIICTITKHNIYQIEEVEAWSKRIKINVSYNIATVNARIDNYDRVSDFTVFNDEVAKMMTQEFFYKKFIEENSKKYFALYLFVRTNKRFGVCPCQYNDWVTVTADGKIAYCATHSKELGDGTTESSYDLFNNNVEYLGEIKSTFCETCSHYLTELNRTGLKLYYDELINNQKVLF